MFDFSLTDDLGFTKAEVNAIRNYFQCSLSYEDFQSMQIVDDYKEEVDEENHLKLPNGRVVYFTDELVNKGARSQFD